MRAHDARVCETSSVDAPPLRGPADAAPCANTAWVLPSHPFRPELREVLYDESCIVVNERKFHSGVHSRFVEELRAAKTSDERQRVVRSVIRMMGFDSLAYATVRLSEGKKHWQSFFTSYVPRDWLNCYFHEAYFEFDPRLRIACASAPPFVWDVEHLADAQFVSARDPKQRQFLCDLDRHGIRSGLIFGITTPGTMTRAIVSLSSASPSRECIAESIVGQALTFGLSLHEFLSGCTQPCRTEPHGNEISDLERRILSCLAGGLSDKEIAIRIRMSHYNVDYHLRLLRRKLGARNRVHLAYLSGRLSLI